MSQDNMISHITSTALYRVYPEVSTDWVWAEAAGIMDLARNRWNVCTVRMRLWKQSDSISCSFGFLVWLMLRSDHRKGMRLSHRISKTSSEWRIKGSCSSSRSFPMRLTLHLHLWAVRSIRRAHLCALHHRYSVYTDFHRNVQEAM